jgi:hypothetical protein
VVQRRCADLLRHVKKRRNCLCDELNTVLGRRGGKTLLILKLYSSRRRMTVFTINYHLLSVQEWKVLVVGLPPRRSWFDINAEVGNFLLEYVFLRSRLFHLTGGHFTNPTYLYPSTFDAARSRLAFRNRAFYMLGQAHRSPPNTPFYIFFQQMYVQNFLNMLHTLRFFHFKMPFIS